MLRTITTATVLALSASASAQAPSCAPELATITVEVPTGRCAAQAPPAPSWMPPPAPPMWPPPVGAAWGLPPAPRTDLAPSAQTRELRGLWISGAAVLGLSWLTTAAVTLARNEEALARGLAFLPVAGPWIQLERGGNDLAGTIALWAGGIAQAVGLAMIVIGASVQRRVRDVSIALAPVEGGATLTVRGAF